MGLAARPDHPYLIRLQAVCALSTGDTVFAHEKIKKVKALRQENGWKEHWVLNELGNIYRDADKFEMAASYYKKSIEKDESYAANCIWVNGTVILARGYPKTAQKILDAGYPILEVDVSEYRKLDGGLSCLSLRF